MKDQSNKQLVMNKRYDGYFENSTKSWICDKVSVDGDVEVTDLCHFTGKYSVSAHRDCNIKIQLNQTF